jgi:hypothetical protein
MLDELKTRWREFKHGQPGRRFQDRFFRLRRTPRSHFWRLALFGGGTLIMAVGVVMLVAPGPGIVVLVIGASLVAQESLQAARWLDWAEVIARRITAWFAAWIPWRRDAAGRPGSEQDGGG